MTAARAPRRRRNVLIIQTDQFRADCFGAAGNPDVNTPNLDQLCTDSIRYSEAFCTLPICTPSRYSMLSGRYVRQHAGWTNRSTPVSATDTFPHQLRQAGYRTAAVGKMHFTPAYLDIGYDRMVLAEQHGPGRYDDDYHRELRSAGLAPVVDLIDQENHLRALAPEAYWSSYGTGVSDLPEQYQSTPWIGARALDQLDRWSDDGGNLLHVSFIKPHHPFDPPKRLAARYEPASLSLPPGWTEHIPEADTPHAEGYFDNRGLNEATLREVLAAYYATITHVDEQIGLLLEAVQRRGMYDDTLIIVTADHGEYLGFHHLLLKNGPMYDPVVKVPLVIKFPGAGKAEASVSNALVSQIDIAPTVLRACGLEPDPSLPGLDLASSAHRDVVFAENRHFGNVVMARSRRHKLIVSDDGTSDSLFDLVEDPCELTNRIHDGAYADVAAELQAALSRWALFDAIPPNHLDVRAPQLDASNVPAACASRSDDHRGWFAKQVTSRLDEPGFRPWAARPETDRTDDPWADDDL